MHVPLFNFNQIWKLRFEDWAKYNLETSILLYVDFPQFRLSLDKRNFANLRKCDNIVNTILEGYHNKVKDILILQDQ